MHSWVAPKGFKIPDFIICGAMKSGTTTLHHILNQHQNVFIPDRELGFFGIDNLVQHPDYSYFDGRIWYTQLIDDDPLHFWSWYSSHFNDALERRVVGGDSTTYLASEVAATRIGLQNKPIKLVVMLRNPTARAYSDYWHRVRLRQGHLEFRRDYPI